MQFTSAKKKVNLKFVKNFLQQSYTLHHSYKGPEQNIFIPSYKSTMVLHPLTL